MTSGHSSLFFLPQILTGEDSILVILPRLIRHRKQTEDHPGTYYFRRFKNHY
jgi:hypothetical protein